MGKSRCRVLGGDVNAIDVVSSYGQHLVEHPFHANIGDPKRLKRLDRHIPAIGSVGLSALHRHTVASLIDLRPILAA